MAPQKGSPGGAAPPVVASADGKGDDGVEGVVAPPPPDGGGRESVVPPLGSTRGLAEVATRTVSMAGDVASAGRGGAANTNNRRAGGRGGEGGGGARATSPAAPRNGTAHRRPTVRGRGVRGASAAAAGVAGAGARPHARREPQRAPAARARDGAWWAARTVWRTVDQRGEGGAVEGGEGRGEGSGVDAAGAPASDAAANPPRRALGTSASARCVRAALAQAAGYGSGGVRRRVSVRHGAGGGWARGASQSPRPGGAVESTRQQGRRADPSEGLPKALGRGPGRDGVSGSGCVSRWLSRLWPRRGLDLLIGPNLPHLRQRPMCGGTRGSRAAGDLQSEARAEPERWIVPARGAGLTRRGRLPARLLREKRCDLFKNQPTFKWPGSVRINRLMRSLAAPGGHPSALSNGCRNRRCQSAHTSGLQLNCALLGLHHWGLWGRLLPPQERGRSPIKPIHCDADR